MIKYIRRWTTKNIRKPGENQSENFDKYFKINPFQLLIAEMRFNPYTQTIEVIDPVYGLENLIAKLNLQ